MSFRCKLYQKKHKGFSLIEVLITSAIIGIMTGIVVVQYGAFNSSVLLKNQAYEIALAVREAQVFSISVRGDQNNTFREEYGIHVALEGAGGTDPTQTVTLFVDADDDDPTQYDVGDIDVERLITDSRFEIYELCIGNTLSFACSGIGDLSITFKRPDFDAEIYSSDWGSGSIASIGLRGTSDRSIIRSVVVNATGQISVIAGVPTGF